MKNHGSGTWRAGAGRKPVTSGTLHFLFVVVLAANSASGKDGSRLTITVRVLNFARVPRPTMVRAEAQAAKVLRKSGIETVWLGCPLETPQSDVPLPCQQAVGPAEVVLRILPSFTSYKGLLPDGTLGFSALPDAGEHGIYASVFFDQAEQFAEGGVASISVILGHAAAHEIGHLLLRSSQHSTVGIMRARWNQEDLRSASRGNLLFTGQQSKFIRAEVRRRSEVTGVAQALLGSESQGDVTGKTRCSVLFCVTPLCRLPFTNGKRHRTPTNLTINGLSADLAAHGPERIVSHSEVGEKSLESHPEYLPGLRRWGSQQDGAERSSAIRRPASHTKRRASPCACPRCGSQT